MERVQLVDRPGSFFVVHRSSFGLRLLDENEQEFCVKPEQELKSAKAPKPVVRKPRAENFSRYRPFIDFLMADPLRVNIYFRVPEDMVPQVMDRYLRLTGENLHLEDITIKRNPKDWHRVSVAIEFRDFPSGIDTPGQVTEVGNWGQWKRLSNNNFAWHMIEHHGLRRRQQHEG